jgi:organic radical activating enzyme
MENLKMKTKDVLKKLSIKIPWVFPSIIKNAYLRRRCISTYKNKMLPTVWLETTNACNLNCIMCPTQRKEAKKFKPDGFINENLFYSIVDEIASEDQTINLRLHKDGEPLLHPKIVELIEYSSSKLLNVSLVTNATLLNKDMANAILSTKLHDIRFSIDGTKDIFEKIRIQSKDNPYASPLIPVDYDSVISNVLYFCKRKRELKKNIRIGVRITDFKSITKDQDKYNPFWKKHVDYIERARYLSWTGKIYRGKKEFVRYPCLNLWSTLVITWNGLLVPCCTYMDSTGDGKGILADLNKSHLCLNKVFYESPAIKEIRRAHINNNLEENAPFCIQCDDWRMPNIDRIWTERMKKELRP